MSRRAVSRKRRHSGQTIQSRQPQVHDYRVIPLAAGELQTLRPVAGVVDLSANVGEFLESRGNTVDYARDGTQGLQLAGSEGYDAVIMDLGLPGLDGLTLCRRLRDTARRDIPIVMLTARDTEADKLSGFDAGADDYVTKPFSLLELQAR